MMDNVKAHHELAAPQGIPQWTGVVMIERPDRTRASHVPFAGPPMCTIRSARTVALDGRRAVVTQAPWSMVHKYFSAGDGDHAFAWAELYGEHLELREGASVREWADFSGPNAIKH